MKKRIKKGFTLVELLVVIGILAVLAVVSVVGYFGFIKKANISNDVSLTTQMNRILQADEAGGDKFDTPHDAVTALKEGGLDVTKLTPTTEGYYYVFDSKQNKMFLLDESKNKVAPNNLDITSETSELYAFIGNQNEITAWANYSLYLKDNFVTTATKEEPLTVSGSIDVGDNENVGYLKYYNTTSKNSLIRTNGGTLIIEAKQDTVKHYGNVDSVEILAIKNESYHEFGNVLASLEVKDGRVVVEENATVKEVKVPETASEGTKVDVSKNSTVNTITVDSDKAKVKVEEDAKVDNVVASENAKANITIPDTVAKISKTHVKTIDDLTKALADKTKYIVFDNDISGYVNNVDDYGMCVKSDVIIDGAGFTFTTTNSRGIALDYFYGDINVSIKNLKLLVNHHPYDGSFPTGVEHNTRGIQIYTESYGGEANLLIDNVEILKNDTNNNEGVHYGVNICNKASVVDLKIVNSQIVGYAALNLWSNAYEVKVSNSILEGINSYSYSKGSNNFGTICLEGDLEGKHASSVDVEIVNTEIIAEVTNDSYQHAIKFNGNSVDNKVYLKNSKITLKGKNALTALNNGAASNKLYIDGVEYSF